MSRLASETVRLSLGGASVELVPSLRAALILARRYGTYGDLIRKIAEGDTRAITDVISVGSDHPTPLLSVMAQIEATGVLQAVTLWQSLIDFVVSLAGPAAEKDGNEKGGKPITFDRFHEQLFEIATGFLGWPPPEAWAATPAEILAAHKGRMDMLKMIFGSSEAGDKAPRDKLDVDQKMRLFFAGTGTRKAKRKAA